MNWLILYILKGLENHASQNDVFFFITGYDSNILHSGKQENLIPKSPYNSMQYKKFQIIILTMRPIASNQIYQLSNDRKGIPHIFKILETLMFKQIDASPNVFHPLQNL